MAWQSLVKDIQKKNKITWQQALTIYRKMKAKPYCKVGIIPKGYRKGSMMECANLGKIGLWGEHKADKIAVQKAILFLSRLNEGQKKKIKEHKMDELKINFARLNGKLKKLMREKDDIIYNIPLERATKKDLKEVNKEIKEIKNEIKINADQYKILVSVKGGIQREGQLTEADKKIIIKLFNEQKKLKEIEEERKANKKKNKALLQIEDFRRRKGF